MSLYSELTDSRSPKKMIFKNGDSDSWGWDADRSQIQQYFGRTVGSVTFPAELDERNPDVIVVQFTSGTNTTLDYIESARAAGGYGIYTLTT